MVKNKRRRKRRRLKVKNIVIALVLVTLIVFIGVFLVNKFIFSKSGDNSLKKANVKVEDK